MRHVPEVEPADYLAQAERAKLIELAGDGGDAAEALTIRRLDHRAIGQRRHRIDRLAALVDVDPHLTMPAQRVLHLAQCLFVGVRDADAPKHVQPLTK